VNRLLGGTHYLVLRTEATSSEHAVQAYPNLESALARWSPRDRLSPIFGLNGAEVPRFDATTWLLFCGPIFPGTLDAPPNSDTYLTLGLFNILNVSNDSAAHAACRALADRAQVWWEAWRVADGRITLVETCTRSRLARTFGPDQRLALTGDYRQLKSVAREYRAELAQAISRAGTYSEALADELFRFDTIVRSLVAATNNQIVNLGVLTIANAALSRHTSQTYSGTVPLFETECHVATHSLLGVGTAGLAIRQLRVFVERAIKESRLFDRLRNLDRQAPVSFNSTLSDPFFRTSDPIIRTVLF
jgi:hypothetical protein